MKREKTVRPRATAITGVVLLLSSACSSDGTTSSTPLPASGSSPESMSESVSVTDVPIDDEGSGGAGDSTGVTAPPSGLIDRLSLDPDFYAAYLDAMGIPVVSSGSVSPYALAEAGWIIERMLHRRDDIAATIGRSNVRVAVMAVDEFTTDLPEHADLEPADWWDRRARGLGATVARPAQSVGEENLLALAGDPYADESIMVHEFAHVVHEHGMNVLEPGFDERLEGIFRQALGEGLWEGTYASTDRNEYFAEGAQSWFGTNRENDGDHGNVDTRDELVTHDPRLAALLNEVFGDNPWQYLRPQDRETGSEHLQGFDRAAAAVFAWPADIADIDISRPPGPDGLVLDNLLEEDWSAERSPRGEAAASVLTIVNRRRSDVRNLWVDFDGNRVSYENIVPGSSFRQNTFAGHLWEIIDDDDRVIGRYRAPAGNAVIVLED